MEKCGTKDAWEARSARMAKESVRLNSESNRASIAQSVQLHVSSWGMSNLPRPGERLGLFGRAGTHSRLCKCQEERPVAGRAGLRQRTAVSEGCVSSIIREGRARNFFFWQESRTNKKSLGTEFARTVQKMVAFAAYPFLDFPFSRSYFELTSCPSTRTWSPLLSAQSVGFLRSFTQLLARLPLALLAEALTGRLRKPGETKKGCPRGHSV